MQPAVPYNNVDFEENIYDFFTFMKYKGELFTGTLIDGDSTTEYKNGNADGRSVGYHDNGQIESDYLYENGNFKSGKEWYRNGQLKFDSVGKEWYSDGQLKRDWTGQDSFCWDTDGMLAKINDTWLYKNGQKINEKEIDGHMRYYSSTGYLASKSVTEANYNHRTLFYDAVMSDCYEELLLNLYPELNPDFNIRYTIFSWVGQTYAQNKAKGKILIHKLMEHPYSKTRELADHLNKLAIRKENGSTYVTYWLENNPNCTIIY